MLLTSCEGVHERGLGNARGHGRTQRRGLGLADLRVGLSELEADGLGQVGVEPHSLLQQNEVKSDAGPYWASGQWGRGAKSSLTILDSIRKHVNPFPFCSETRCKRLL